MSDPYIQNLFADRIGGKNYGKGTAIYKFEKIKRAKRAALAANPGAELIDMGVGEPDEMAFPDVRRRAATRPRKQPENRGYADNGGAALPAGRGAVDEERLRRRGIDPDNADRPLHRLQGRAVDPARRASSTPATSR